MQTGALFLVNEKILIFTVRMPGILFVFRFLPFFFLLMVFRFLLGLFPGVVRRLGRCLCYREIGRASCRERV